MTENFSMTNVQNIPGDTDINNLPINDDEELREKDNNQVPPDKQPFVTPINDPPYEEGRASINENSNEPQRIMRAWTKYERRIF